MCLKENARKDGELFLNKIVKKRPCAFAIESIVLSLISLVSPKEFPHSAKRKIKCLS